jgi:c(7)-type cytochrome triheme protein
MLVMAVGFAANPPTEIVFDAKMGKVKYDHAAHAKRVKEDCTACHDKLFKQSREPLNFKAGMHKPAIAAKASCGGCHHPDGAAFDATSTANCKKCHGN